MLKFLIDIFQISIILWLAGKAIKFFFGKNRYSKNKKSIMSKLSVLVSRRIHFHLDNMIKGQKVKFAQIKEQKENLVPTTEQDSQKVSNLQKYKREKGNYKKIQTN